MKVCTILISLMLPSTVLAGECGDVLGEVAGLESRKVTDYFSGGMVSVNSECLTAVKLRDELVMAAITADSGAKEKLDGDRFVDIYIETFDLGEEGDASDVIRRDSLKATEHTPLFLEIPGVISDAEAGFNHIYSSYDADLVVVSLQTSISGTAAMSAVSDIILAVDAFSGEVSVKEVIERSLFYTHIEDEADFTINAIYFRNEVCDVTESGTSPLVIIFDENTKSIRAAYKRANSDFRLDQMDADTKVDDLEKCYTKVVRGTSLSEAAQKKLSEDSNTQR